MVIAGVVTMRLGKVAFLCSLLCTRRCNGSYPITFAGHNCPKGVYMKYNQRYQLYAFLDELSGDNLAYINQASDSVTLSNHKSEQFSADIFRLRHTKRLVAAFTNDCHDSFHNRSKVQVKFNLKKSYFKDLLDSVRALHPSIISRIMPTQESFRGLTLGSCDLMGCELYCSEEQACALHTMAALPSNGPPILLNGAFGTGKSRLLALSARYFQSTKSRHPVRVLVCTQQRVSADKFLEYYLETWVGGQKGEVCVIREYAHQQIDPKYRKYYVTSKEFKLKYENILVITTCLTAPHLHFLKQGYFTHILIDEGSQMREPEAVAPLCLADANTKIVIAGDQNQVKNLVSHSMYI